MGHPLEFTLGAVGRRRTVEAIAADIRKRCPHEFASQGRAECSKSRAVCEDCWSVVERQWIRKASKNEHFMRGGVCLLCGTREAQARTA